MIDKEEHSSLRDSRGEVAQDEQRGVVRPLGVVNNQDGTTLARRPGQGLSQLIEQLESLPRSTHVGTGERLALESERTENLPPGPERRCTGTLRTAPPGHLEAGGKGNPGELLRQAGFPDAWLAGHEDDTTPSLPGIVQKETQRRQLTDPTSQGARERLSCQ